MREKTLKIVCFMDGESPSTVPLRAWPRDLRCHSVDVMFNVATTYKIIDE